MSHTAPPDFPPASAEDAPPPPATTSRRKPALIALAVGVLLAALLAAWKGGTAYSGRQREKTQAQQLTAAKDACVINDPALTIADSGHTLSIDGLGTEDPAGATVATLTCVLDALETPQAVREHMFATRALDGRQWDAWETYTASWSYHPDNGLDLIVQAR